MCTCVCTSTAACACVHARIHIRIYLLWWNRAKGDRPVLLNEHNTKRWLKQIWTPMVCSLQLGLQVMQIKYVKWPFAACQRPLLYRDVRVARHAASHLSRYFNHAIIYTRNNVLRSGFSSTRLVSQELLVHQQGRWPNSMVTWLSCDVHDWAIRRQPCDSVVYQQRSQSSSNDDDYGDGVLNHNDPEKRNILNINVTNN